MSLRPHLGNASFVSPDAILYVISAQSLSKRKLAQLRADTASATTCASALIRIDGEGQSLPEAMLELCEAGHLKILVQPLGLPWSEALSVWLSGALSHWQKHDAPEGATVSIGDDVAASAAGVSALVGIVEASAKNARPASQAKPALGKPGWQNPPDFTHHLLVCTGARCHFRDAASLLLQLKGEIARQGISDRCLTARTGCLYPCNQGPMVAVYPRGEWYRLHDAESVARFVGDVLVDGETVPDLLIHTANSVRETQELSDEN
jgi:(2Fe-2S) ferredoxin